MYQQIIIIGNTGGAPNMRYTPAGIAVCDFSVAVSKRRGKGEDRTEETIWMKITCWRDLAEVVAQFVTKGMKVMVVGEVSVSAYIDKSGQPAASLQITAKEVKFLDSKEQSANNGEYQQESTQEEYYEEPVAPQQPQPPARPAQPARAPQQQTQQPAQRPQGKPASQPPARKPAPQQQRRQAAPPSDYEDDPNNVPF